MKLFSLIVGFFITNSFTLNKAQTFTKITSGDIVNDGGLSNGNVWGDYDNDDDLDLFVSTRFQENNFLYRNDGDSTFFKITSGALVNDGGYSRGVTWGDYDNDGFLDLFVARIDYDNDGNLDLFVANWDNQKNFLYHNDGVPNYTFTKITSGDITNDMTFSGSVSWCDYNDDGYIDLFVGNPHDQDNFLYQNDGLPNYTFTKIISGNIVNENGESLGSHWGDYDNDGDFDLIVANRTGEDNFLYSNNGDGTFDKITNINIINNVGDSQGCSWADYNNDGNLDLFITNLSQNNVLYMNNGDGTFTEITNEIVVSENTPSQGSSWCDYDNDGFLDLFVATDLGGDNCLYRNNGNSNSWINLKCIGVVSNHSAIGTRVRAKAIINGNPVWQLRQISGQTGWLSQNSLNVEFGFGDASIIDSLVIEWPASSTIDIFTNVKLTNFTKCLKVVL